MTSDEAGEILYRRRPPQYVIDEAVRYAKMSPCAKSKRGAVLYNSDDAERYAIDRAMYATVVVGGGFNGPPPTFKCTADGACRTACPKICLHAEDRAIRAAGILDDVHDLELVHVKVVDGALVPGGGPSCWQCSRTIVDVGLRGVWLFVGNHLLDGPTWRYYSAVEFHVETLKNQQPPLPSTYRWCARYVGDNDATSPNTICIRPAGHRGACDNVKP